MMTTQLAIQDLQEKMLAMPQVEIKVMHDRSGGMLARTVLIKKGTRLVGAVHLTDHVNIVYGDISIFDETGERRLTGYNVVPSKAGIKRVGRAHEDTYWTTILKTDLEPDAAIAEMTAKDYNDPRVIALNKLTEIGK